jgi:endoglucanase
LPDKDRSEYTISPKSSNSTVAFAAVCALAASFYRKIDSGIDFSEKLAKAALNAWLWYAENGVKSKLRGGLLFWAVCELYALTGEDDFLAAAKTYFQTADITSFDMDDISGFGMLSVFFHVSGGDLELRRKLMSALRVKSDNLTAKSAMHIITRNDFSKYSNIGIMSDAIALRVAAAILKNDDYLRAARRDFDYILGSNPLGKCYVTGVGNNPVIHPHQSLCAAVPDAYPPTGLVVFGPSADRFSDSFLKWQLPKTTPPAKSYGDAPSSRSTNASSMWAVSMLFFLSSL